MFVRQEHSKCHPFSSEWLSPEVKRKRCDSMQTQQGWAKISRRPDSPHFQAILQPRVNWLTLQSKDTEDALMNSAEGFFMYESLQCF